MHHDIVLIDQSQMGSVQSGLAPVRAGGRHAASISIGLGEVLDRVTMQLFVRGYCTMIAAPVQGDVDGIPKGSHDPEVSPISIPLLLAAALYAVSVGLHVPQYVAPGQQKVPPVAPTDIIRQGRANTLVEHW